MRLIIDQADAAAIAMLAQRHGDLETGMAGADDQDGSLLHAIRPV
jgi:hypothetical protein